MTHTQITCPKRIALRTGKKRARPAGVGALASVFEKIQVHRYIHSEDIKYHDTGNGWTLASPCIRMEKILSMP